jgi:hypothetical protein
MGLAEVAGGDGSVDRAHDLPKGDLGRVAGQHVAAPDPPLRPHQACALEGEQDLLEVGLGETGALCDVAHRRGSGLVQMQGEGEEGPARVVAPGGHLHSHSCYVA